MHCPYCQKEHPEGALFCPETGGPLPGKTAQGATVPVYPEPVDTVPFHFTPPGSPSPTDTARLFPEPVETVPLRDSPPEGAPTPGSAYSAAIPGQVPGGDPNRGLRWALGGLVAVLVLAAAAFIILLTGGFSTFQDWAGALFPGNRSPVAAISTAEAEDQPARKPLFPAPGLEKTATLAPEQGQGPPANDVPTETGLVTAVPPTKAPAAPPTATPPPLPVLMTPTYTPPPAANRYSGWFVYVSGDDNLREIFMMNPSSGETRQVTSNTWTEEWPSFSPDNRSLAYAAFRDGSWQVYVRELDTGKETQITHFDGQARCPQWSPQPGSKRILFEGRTGQPGNMLIDIWAVDADGKNLKKVTTSTADIRPRWSPDGSKFVVGRALADTNSDGRIRTSDNLDVFVVELDTGKETRLTGTPENDDFQFAWSPDGQTLAVSSVRGDVDGNGVRNLDDAQGLYLMPAAGGRERYLEMNNLHVFSPDWSPDGKQIVFIADVGSDNEIWMYEVDGGALKRLSKAGAYYHTAWAH